jgi:hypothetical protein
MAEQQALRRRTRRQRVGILVAVLVAVGSVALAGTGQAPGSTSNTSQTVTTPAAGRERLLGMLTARERVRLEQFEAQVEWLDDYMRASTDFNAGAAAARFLSEMPNDMSAVPSMHQEMQAMKARMAAVPAMVAETQAINAKLAVITGTMDSTMGRAGRMLPWMPFAPWRRIAPTSPAHLPSCTAACWVPATWARDADAPREVAWCRGECRAAGMRFRCPRRPNPG